MPMTSSGLVRKAHASTPTASHVEPSSSSSSSSGSSLPLDQPTRLAAELAQLQTTHEGRIDALQRQDRLQAEASVELGKQIAANQEMTAKLEPQIAELEKAHKYLYELLNEEDALEAWNIFEVREMYNKWPAEAYNPFSELDSERLDKQKLELEKRKRRITIEAQPQEINACLLPLSTNKWSVPQKRHCAISIERQKEEIQDLRYEHREVLRQLRDLARQKTSLETQVESHRRESEALRLKSEQEVVEYNVQKKRLESLLREAQGVLTASTKSPHTVSMPPISTPKREPDSSSSSPSLSSSSTRVPAPVAPMGGIGLGDLPAEFTLRLDTIATEKNLARRSRLVRESLKAADIRKTDLKELYIAIGSPHTRTQDYLTCEHFCFMHIGNHIEQLTAFIADKKRAAARDSEV